MYGLFSFREKAICRRNGVSSILLLYETKSLSSCLPSIRLTSFPIRKRKQENKKVIENPDTKWDWIGTTWKREENFFEISITVWYEKRWNAAESRRQQSINNYEVHHDRRSRTHSLIQHKDLPTIKFRLQERKHFCLLLNWYRYDSKISILLCNSSSGEKNNCYVFFKIIHLLSCFFFPANDPWTCLARIRKLL
jgi:hypothetical protein